MIQIKSIDKTDLIINIAEIYLIKSNGDKTVIFVRGFDKPIYTQHNIKEITNILTQHGVLKGTEDMGISVTNMTENSISLCPNNNPSSLSI